MKPLQQFLHRTQPATNLLRSILSTTETQTQTRLSSQHLPSEILAHLRTSLRRPLSVHHPSAHHRHPYHPSSLFRGPRQRRQPYSTRPPHSNPPPARDPYNPTPHLTSPPPSLSLSQRLRKLSREYGWSAFGVYLLLSALDFPFCFAAVRYIGADRVGRYEHIVVGWVGDRVPEGVKEGWRGVKGMLEGWRGQAQGQLAGDGEVAGYDHGVGDAERRNESENASIWTQLALAYAIHKSFIFIRVPLTVAVTPKVVKVLRGWGWDIGKRRPKVPKGPNGISKD